MLKKVFYIFLSIFVLFSFCVLPFSAAVVTPDNSSSFISSALMDLYYDSSPAYWGSISNNVTAVSGGPIHYPQYRGTDLLDPNGFYIWFICPTDELTSDQQFGFQLASGGVVYYPTYYTNYSFTFADYTISYYWFTYSSWLDVFSAYGYNLVPTNCSLFLYNPSDSSNFSFLSCGVSSYTIFKEFTSNINSFNSYDNGITSGAALINSPFLSSTLSLSYLSGGSWNDIAIDSIDLSSYINSTVVNLDLLQNLGLTGLPSNSPIIRLTFTLPRAIDVASYTFGSYNPSGVIETYDPADIRTERFGIWFSNTNNGVTLFPSVALTDTLNNHQVSYGYYYPPDSYFDQINVELDYNTYSSLLTSGVSLADYISYRLIDFDSGYDLGFIDGEEQGFTNGYNQGKQDGYLIGKSDGLATAEEGSFLSLFSAVIDAPVQAFTNLLNFELFGQNMAAFALSIITLIVVIKIVGVVI